MSQLSCGLGRGGKSTAPVTLIAVEFNREYKGNFMKMNIVKIILILIFVIGLTACGSGGGSGNTGINDNPITYNLSGAITANGTALSGVSIALSGTGSGSTTTDNSGAYAFSALPNGTYYITPSKTGYTFSPNFLTVPINGSNATGQSFSASVMAAKLPTKFIAVFTPTNSTNSTPQQQLDGIKNVAVKAKNHGIQAVNLVVEWRDLESQQGTIDFGLLDDMILEIKSRGLFCILRIYVNVDTLWKAWPSWLSPTQAYYAGSVQNILPWDSTYQAAFESLQSRLTSHFASTMIQPDAMQITVGGSFGEQVLNNFAYQFDTLMTAERQHVDMYFRTIGRIAKDHILMVNSLMPSNSALEDEVGIYAESKNTAWIESNAGACILITNSGGYNYGPSNMLMLQRFKNRGAKIYLEDESGRNSCSNVGQIATLSHRVNLMKQLQNNYSLTFDAVSINAWNGDLDDNMGMNALKEMMGL